MDEQDYEDMEQEDRLFPWLGDESAETEDFYWEDADD